MKVFLWQTTLSSVYNFWFSFDIFKRKNLKFLWLRLIVTAILISAMGWAIMNYLPMFWVRNFT
jgi:hypothetical protein